MKNIKTNAKPDLVYSKKGKSVYIEFKTLMPSKFSSQERAQLREFEKRIIKNDLTQK